MNIKRITTTALAIAIGTLLSACTSGNSAVQPTVRGADIIGGTALQLAVGTANGMSRYGNRKLGGLARYAITCRAGRLHDSDQHGVQE